MQKSVAAIDLFCGAGGLTKGLELSGINVRLGIDIDPSCAFPYEANNHARFLLKPIEKVSARDIEPLWKDSRVRLLAGCAPCQPFSTYSRGKSGPSDKRWHLLKHFSRLVEETLPDIVTMENVPRLEQLKVFRDFDIGLRRLGFEVFCKVVNCADYSVPQQRRRLVLMASRLGPIEMIPPARSIDKYMSVRDAIGRLPTIKAGEVCKTDPLHQTSRLSQINLMRIISSRPGGAWRDWDQDLIANCHRQDSGKSYTSVYGRMEWDIPAPTITTQFYGFGNGRFGHPEQDRALSLREGAILQSFPRRYKFVSTGEPIFISSLGRLIGNAVPVKLGEAIGNSIFRHLVKYHRV